MAAPPKVHAIIKFPHFSCYTTVGASNIADLHIIRHVLVEGIIRGTYRPGVIVSFSVQVNIVDDGLIDLNDGCRHR